jgi:hypothetical protein
MPRASQGGAQLTPASRVTGRLPKNAFGVFSASPAIRKSVAGIAEKLRLRSFSAAC